MYETLTNLQNIVGFIMVEDKQTDDRAGERSVNMKGIAQLAAKES
jgi:hypothetical protein